jgi:hypothetical protein
MDNVTVALNGKLAGEYTAYARKAGITLEAAVNTALDEWMENEGSYIYAGLVKRNAARTAKVNGSRRKKASVAA